VRGGSNAPSAPPVRSPVASVRCARGRQRAGRCGPLCRLPAPVVCRWSRPPVGLPVGQDESNAGRYLTFRHVRFCKYLTINNITTYPIAVQSLLCPIGGLAWGVDLPVERACRCRLPVLAGAGPVRTPATSATPRPAPPTPAADRPPFRRGSPSPYTRHLSIPPSPQPFTPPGI